MTPVVSELAAADSPLFVAHRHADRDALGAAVGLRELLGRGTVCTPDGVAGPARPLLEATGTDPVTDPNLDAYDVVVVVDSPSGERIEPVDPQRPVLVDHHEPSDLTNRASAAFVDTEAGATAELVARLAEEADWELTPDAALPLLVGLLDDTGFLAAATPATVESAVDLAGALGDRATDLPPLVERPSRPGERMARALGTLRASGYRSGDLVVAVTRVGGHETAATHSLRDAGVDLAVACAEQSDGLRVTARASDAFVERMNLGSDLLPALADEFDGDGGGHAGAGVAHLDAGTPADVESYLVDRIERELGVTFGVVSP